MLRILTMLAVLFAAAPAQADLESAIVEAMRATDRYDFALWLARVSANEGALWDRREMDLVWQTTETNGGRDLPGWLRRHSPRVHSVPGMKPCRPGRNCEWSRQLDRRGTKPPALDVRQDYWEVVLRPTWLDLLDYADYLVAGGAYNAPCHRPPRTWGNEHDAAGAAERGLYPLHCATRFNDGYAPVWRDPESLVCEDPSPISYGPVMEVAWLK